MGLLIFLAFSISHALYVKTFYADSLCSGQILFADHIVSSDSSCSPVGCTPIGGGDYYTVACPNSFFTLGLDQTSYASTTTCSGAIDRIRTFPLAPTCSAGVIYTCNSTTVVDSTYTTPTCIPGTLVATQVIQQGACVSGGSIKYVCTANGVTIMGLSIVMLLINLLL